MAILMIDDDRELCALMQRFLAGEGWRLDCAHDGETGLAKARDGDYELAIIDIMMPGMNGMEVLRALRRDSSLPVIMLSARGEEMDRILGLELGADDYLPKPCNPRELAARIRAILRRSAARDDRDRPIRCGALSLHDDAHLICENDRRLDLTRSEYNILAELIRHGGEVVTRQELSRRALGKPLGPFDRALDMHIANLRKKLTPKADGESVIRTVRGVGWMLLPE
ncbi:MAG: response regulator transcription factor [Mariprofundaceae bacterium]